MITVINNEETSYKMLTKYIKSELVEDYQIIHLNSKELIKRY